MKLKDKIRLLCQAMEILSERPFQLVPGEAWEHMNLIQLLEGIPYPRSQICVSQQCSTPGTLLFFSPLWSKCLLRCTASSGCLPSEIKDTPPLFQMVPCLHDFQTPTEQAGFNPQTQFQLVTAGGFMRSLVWRQEENIG